MSESKDLAAPVEVQDVRDAGVARAKVSLGDLLNEIGGEKIRYQVLGHVLDGEQRTRKDGTTCFKFASLENLSDVMSGRREALIVWMDGGECEAARQRLIARYGPSPKASAQSAVEGPLRSGDGL